MNTASKMWVGIILGIILGLGIAFMGIRFSDRSEILTGALMKANNKKQVCPACPGSQYVTRAAAIKAIFNARGLNNQPAFPNSSSCLTLDPNTWYFSWVAQAINEGWVDCLVPSSWFTESISRAEFLKAVLSANNLMNNYQAPASPTFTDVPPGTWYYDYIEAAVQNKLISPVSPFNPNDPADQLFILSVLGVV